MGEVLPDTLYAGLINPFECPVEYMHDKSRNPGRHLARQTAWTQGLVAV